MAVVNKNLTRAFYLISLLFSSLSPVQALLQFLAHHYFCECNQFLMCLLLILTFLYLSPLFGHQCSQRLPFNLIKLPPCFDFGLFILGLCSAKRSGNLRNFLYAKENYHNNNYDKYPFKSCWNLHK